MAAWQTVYAGVERWLLTALTQRAALAFNVGALAATLYTVTVRALAFAWSTTLEIDTDKGEAVFLYNGDANGAPRVAFPPDADGAYVLDLVVDPELGLGVLYINDFRALSFRYYRVGATTIALFAEEGFAALQGTVSVRSTDQIEEKPNG